MYIRTVLVDTHKYSTKKYFRYSTGTCFNENYFNKKEQNRSYPLKNQDYLK